MKKLRFLILGLFILASCEGGILNPNGPNCPSQPEIFAPEGFQVETVGTIELVSFEGSLKDVEFVSEQVGFVMATNQRGRYVEVLKTVDGGKSWRDVEIGIEQKPWKVFFLNEQVGFISVHDVSGCPPPNCEQRSVLLKTEDAGETWNEIIYPELKGFFYELKADDEGILYANIVERDAQTFQPLLIRSRDQGASWDTVFSSSGFVFAGLFSFEVSKEHIFLNGSNGKIGVTDKNGNIEKVITPSPGGVIDFQVFDEQHIIASIGGAIVKSSDLGDTWEVIHEGGGRLIGFETKDKGLAFIVKSTCEGSGLQTSNLLASTQDGGSSWVEAEKVTTNIGWGLFNADKVGVGTFMILSGDRLTRVTEN